METPKEIFLNFFLDGNDFNGMWSLKPIEAAEISERYIRADITKLTWEDMRLAFRVINEAIDNCEGKTKQEIFEDALKRFNKERK